MSDLIFTITLRDLKTLSDAVVELDACKNRGDARVPLMVSAGHAAVIRTLGEQVGLIYNMEGEAA